MEFYVFNKHDSESDSDSASLLHVY